MSYYDYQLLREDRRFLGTRVKYNEGYSLKMASDHRNVSLVFGILGVLCLFPPFLLFLMNSPDKTSFFFASILFGGFAMACFVGCFLAAQMSQSILVSSADQSVNAFLNRKLRLSIPFSNIIQTEFKRYAVGSESYYPVSILTQEKKRICLYETTQFQEARQICENLSKLMRVPMLDHSSQEKSLRSLQTLDDSVVKRLKEAPLPTDLNLSLKIIQDIDGYTLIDRNPTQQKSGLYLLAMGGILLTINVSLLIMALNSTSQETSKFYIYLVPFVLAGLTLFIAGIYYLGKRTFLQINSQRLRYVTTVFGFPLMQEEILLPRIEDVVIDESPAQFREIKIISDQKIISLDSRQLGSMREMYFIKNFITNLLLQYLPQDQKH